MHLYSCVRMQLQGAYCDTDYGPSMELDHLRRKLLKGALEDIHRVATAVMSSVKYRG